MRIFHDMKEWRHLRQSLAPLASIGFVPTMGNLHQGHVSLLTQSVHENDCTVTSLFVNPTQFNNPADFKHYPRTLDDDLTKLKQAGVDYCLLPDETTLYADDYRYHVDEVKDSLILEGKHRPGHFKGVLTVVMKLLNLVKPHRAYFGEKDYQQYQLIKGMVDAFFMDIDIIPCPTIRETSGLACSSRNTRLTEKERQLADDYARIFHQSKPCEALIAELEQKGIEVDYLEEHDGRRFIAVNIGNIRLIDNRRV